MHKMYKYEIMERRKVFNMEKIVTKLFGEIGIDDEKVILFPDGIIGFGNLKKFLLVHDSEKKDGIITWLQSIDEPGFAIPVIDPLIVKGDYNPVVEDELLGGIGEITEDEVFVLVTLKVPSDITQMTVNLKAPIVINPNTKKGCQILTDNEEYPIRYPIYDLLKAMKKEGE